MTTAVDTSGNGHTGTYVGSPSSHAGLVTGSGLFAAEFHSATNDHVIQDDTIAPGSIAAFTIGVIMQWHANAANQPTLFGIEDPGGNAYLVLYLAFNQTIHVIPADDSITMTNLASTTFLSADTIYDAIATWDGTTLTLYVDGVAEATHAYSGAFTISEALKFEAACDVFSETGNTSLDGVLGHVFCSLTHAATPTEVAAIHAARTGSGDVATAIAAVDPTIYWILNELTPPAPTCSSVTPNTGYTTGGENVVLAGTGFTDTEEVDFGGTPAAAFTVDSDSQITATTPAHAEGTVNVTVTTPGGTSA